VSFGREPVRIGRSSSAELCFSEAPNAMVSTHHAQIVFERGTYYVVDTSSTNGTLVNGRKVVKQRLESGDRLCFGHPGGPEVDVEIEGSDSPTAWASTVVQTVAPTGGGPASSPSAADATRHDTGTLRVAGEAAQQLAQRRAQAGGSHSGDTVIILAQAMDRVSQVERSRSARRWRKVVSAIGGTALLVIGVLAVVVFMQRQELNRLVNAKASIDRDIQTLQESMQTETDPVRLAALEDRLVALTGSAQSALRELKLRDEARAAQISAGGDELDREIRKILAKFNATTYAVPPIFRERLQFHIDTLAAAGNRKFMYGRKQRYWPMIMKEFGALGLPEEMAYIAWVESGFDPTAQSGAGALGLWQMTTTTAQSLGLTVASGVDERLDPEKQTKAAAAYLARLLSEFGEDSFMLALASYNRGENGVRRALGQVAREAGGWRKDKRDFWHLYRLKLLPEETREYVPKVLAAAIVASNPQKYGLVN